MGSLLAFADVLLWVPPSLHLAVEPGHDYGTQDRSNKSD